MIKKKLTELSILIAEAEKFAESESIFNNSALYGVTDGKAVGTYLEHKFKEQLEKTYEVGGSSANGLDIPSAQVDIKVTSIKQPQSSCPFKSASQKIYGLGYNLLLFVYEKKDDPQTKTSRLNILHSVLVEKERTGDFQMTKIIRDILVNKGNADDLMACFFDRNLPVDEIEAKALAEKILKEPPEQGYLTISNALQWRLQYARVVEMAGEISGINLIRGGRQ
ncbi:hypothetical protein EZJ49_05260 [Bdellovibrio bacteriovorus]|uniref:hypothetical protein n=1 Tax=Bdellovibrio bacteriovorus TaxID=959 RepID=UPI0021CF1489|nr:hypothetical protein [Bdellovibrio bacteriovorus]UXR65656.1 hypothetical protein EZJ49_05260 [Bdellovibrio bacteriovorus]